MADTTPYRASSPDLVIVPLRSDPPWLSAGLLAVTLGSIGLVMLYMFVFVSVPRPSLGLAVIPGLALATFAGAFLGWWGRRRGGTMSLEAAPQRVVLREPHHRQELVDRVMPFAAALLRDTSTPRRLLVLSQSGEPITLLDASRAAPPSSDAWAARTIALDLSGAAISPATPHVLTIASRGSLDALLASLEADLEPAAALVAYPLPSGEVLQVMADELRLGARVVPYATSTARRIAIATPSGDSQAISLSSGATTLLLARLEPSETGEAPATLSEAPDAYLPPLVYELVASRFAIAPSPKPGTAAV